MEGCLNMFWRVFDVVWIIKSEIRMTHEKVVGWKKKLIKKEPWDQRNHSKWWN